MVKVNLHLSVDDIIDMVTEQNTYLCTASSLMMDNDSVKTAMAGSIIKKDRNYYHKFVDDTILPKENMRRLIELPTFRNFMANYLGKDINEFEKHIEVTYEKYEWY